MSNGRPPKTLTEWVAYLHAARAVPQDSPDYGDAQEAMRFALQRIRTLNVVASSKDPGAETQVRPASPATALGLGMAHGASFGAGEPLAGLLAALVPGGQGFGEGAQQYRQGLENIGIQQPTATPAGEMAGMALGSFAPVSGAVGGGTATAAMIPSTRANVLARFLTGAGQTNVLPGVALGGIGGFSAGGEDPGDLGARVAGAATGGALGAAGQAFFGGLGALRVPRWLNSVKREIRQAVPKGTPRETVEGMTDAAIRQQLTRQGFDEATQGRILTSWRAGKTEVPPPPMAPILRPGETVSELPPQAPRVGPRGTRTTTPDPLDVATFQRRGVGGHSYAGTFPAGSGEGLPGRAAPSPVGGPMTPQAIQLQQLQMLAQLPEHEFQLASALFPPEIVQQLRQVRAQMVGGALP